MKTYEPFEGEINQIQVGVDPMVVHTGPPGTRTPPTW